MLKRGIYPINIKFLKWQESTVGSYIEFKIRVRLQEGLQTNLFGKERTSTPIMNRETLDTTCEWDIYKRYSNFVMLNN